MRIIFLLAVLICCSKEGLAQSITLFDMDLQNRRTYLEYFLFGKNDFPRFKQLTTEELAGVKERLCGQHLRNFLITESERSKYNDIFHEMDDAEQRTDVAILKEKVEATEDCIERFKLWVAYDDKWYKEQRDAAFSAREKQEKAWADSVKDSGSDIYDVVIEGVHFAIPRKYIWFGSRRPDGYIVDVNLQFFYPDMSARPTDDPEYKDKKTNIGGILQRDIIETKVCPSVEIRETCTNNYVTRAGRPSGRSEKITCVNKNRYYPWMADCTVDATYDESVGMMMIDRGNKTDKLFYEGPFLFPDYWLDCQKPPVEEGGKYICESYLMLRDNIAFGYSFPRELFWKHREIHDALRAKLESFIVKDNELKSEKGN